MPQLRIALSLPGEASLGSFQAGAVSALLVALREVNHRAPDAVRLDVITGASSGALTAVLAARALLGGQDPVAPLRRAWVSEPSLEALRGRDRLAPLSLERARQVAREELVRAIEPGSARGAQAQPVTLEFALASLRGFDYAVPRRGRRVGGDDETTPATSYVDWWRGSFGGAEAAGFTSAWAAAVDAAVASASHPAGFPPVALDRRAMEDRYRANGVTNLPADLELWYADGGLVDREPLGRCLALAREADRDADGDIARLLLLVDPDVDVAPGPESGAWAGGEAPTWTATLGRALRLIAFHSLYEDLRRVEKTNDRLARIDALAAELAGLLPDDERTRTALTRALGGMEEAGRAWRRDRLRAAGCEADGADGDSDGPDGRGPGERGAGREPERDIQGLLAGAIRMATGLESKVPTDVEVVTAKRSQLGGGGLFQFGGFLAERLRAQDFLVGYANMLAWMEGPRGLEAAGVDPELARSVGDEVRARARDIPGWLGGGGRRRLPLAAQARLLQLSLRAARIGLRGARSGGTGR